MRFGRSWEKEDLEHARRLHRHLTQQSHQQQAANQEGGGEEKSKTTKMAKNWYKV